MARRVGVGLAWLLGPALVAACGGGAPAALALGTEAVVQHGPPGMAEVTPTTLAVTVLRVRTGTMAELEAAGLEIDVKDRERTPLYVDARFENRGGVAIPGSLGVSMEDDGGNLISSVVVFAFGGGELEVCPDRTGDELAPGETVETCELFFVGRADEAARVSFLPYVPGQETEWVYWAIP